MRNKNEELLPYYEKAKHMLHYNQKTGLFFKWINTRNEYVQVGRVATTGHSQIGITINKKRRHLMSHRLAWYIYHGELPCDMIDHKNRNKLDNSIDNLRLCTNQENQFNTTKQCNNKTGFKGVYWYDRYKKYRASIIINGKNISLGNFDCPKKASEAYQAKAREMHGEFYHEG